VLLSAPLGGLALIVSPPKLSVGWEEDETVLPRHSTPIRRGRMVTWLHCRCRPLFPLKPEELWWHSCVFSLRGAIPFLAALGPRLSIGITIEVTPFIDVLAVGLLLFLLEEFPFNTYHSLHREPPSHGFGVVLLTLARLERLFCPSVSGDRFPDLFLHSGEVSYSRASAPRSWTLLLFPRD
jgi:hypothetical protein